LIGRRLAAGSLAIALLATACGDEVPDGPATLDQLAGPWQHEPYIIDTELERTAFETCADSWTPPASPQTRLMPGLVDARGGGRLVVRLIEEGGGYTQDCFGLGISSAGEISPRGYEYNIGNAPPAWLDPGEVIVDGMRAWADEPTEWIGSIDPGDDCDATTTAVTGRAGSAIASVIVIVPGREPVVASLVRGYYAAWWPGGPEGHVVGRTADGAQLASVALAKCT
jgi:hypothetical protein